MDSISPSAITTVFRPRFAVPSKTLPATIAVRIRLSIPRGSATGGGCSFTCNIPHMCDLHAHGGEAMTDHEDRAHTSPSDADLLENIGTAFSRLRRRTSSVP